MTKDDIIRMAMEADLLDERDALADPVCEGLIVYLEHFAALVAAAEREACAKVCDESQKEHEKECNKRHGSDILYIYSERYAIAEEKLAKAIRARSQS
jgi:hypothetical protein